MNATYELCKIVKNDENVVSVRNKLIKQHKEYYGYSSLPNCSGDYNTLWEMREREIVKWYKNEH